MSSAPMVADRPADRVCSKCQSWLCAAEDAYCGHCGEPCAVLTLEALPAILPLGQVLPRVPLRLTNGSCAPLLTRYWILPEWLEYSGSRDAEVPARGSKVFYVKANTLNLRQPQASEVGVQTSIGNVSLLMMVIAETPQLVANPSPIEYWLDATLGFREYEVEVYPSGGQLRVCKLRDPGVPWVSVRTVLPNPLLISWESPLKMLIRVDEGRAAGRLAVAPETKTKAHIDVEYEGPHGIAQTPIVLEFKVRRPPVITLVGEHGQPRPAYQSKEQPLTFRFSNLTDNDPMGGRQNGRLEIRSATLQPANSSLQANAKLLSVLPIEIAGGDSGDLDFLVNLASFDPAISYFDLKITTNRAQLDRSYRIPIQVRPLENFEGIVAIDFGTSNTCCALLPDGGDPTSVALDEQRTTAPTIVRYLDLSGPEPLTETGSRVKQLAAVEEKVASSTIMRLKQLLGEATHPVTVLPMKSSEWVSREPRDAAADYLHHLRSVVEKRQNALFGEFILTHPAVCSLRQYRNLRAALENAFGHGAKVHFLQEPIAALVPFFHQKTQNGARPGYTVAAFDLGGGTTDITLVRVSQASSGTGILEIRPEILASWGERFGGEDLTDFVVEEVKRRCSELLAQQRPGYQISMGSVRGSSTLSVRRNESALREWAESFKASLSDEKSTSPLPPAILLTVVPDDLNLPPDIQQFASDQVRQHREPLEYVFLAYVSQRIGRLADRLQESTAGKGPLDFIHLSGKTAFLPEVGRVLEKRFEQTTIERAPDPKEIVVRGACLWRSLVHGRKVRLILPNAIRRTTSQIGLMDEDGTFIPLIPLDKPVPDEGLQVSDRWDGGDRLVLWENLGIENQRVLPDGTRNPLIARLGAWEPETPFGDNDDQWQLNLKLCADFSLQVTISSDGKVVSFRPGGTQR